MPTFLPGSWEGPATPAGREHGLLKGERHHLHLSAEPHTAAKVGRRYGKPVVLKVQAGRMHADGYAFFLSANGVWLRERVPAAYLDLSAGREENP